MKQLWLTFAKQIRIVSTLLTPVSEICFHPTRVMYIAFCAAEAEFSFKQFYELGLR